MTLLITIKQILCFGLHSAAAKNSIWSLYGYITAVSVPVLEFSGGELSNKKIVVPQFAVITYKLLFSPHFSSSHNSIAICYTWPELPAGIASELVSSIEFSNFSFWFLALLIRNKLFIPSQYTCHSLMLWNPF